MTAMILIIIQFLLLLSLSRTKAAEPAANNIALPGCQDSCGGVLIPYPFGIGPNCSLSIDYAVDCNTTNNGSSTPYFLGGDLAIQDINLLLGQAHISSPISSQCYNITTKTVDNNGWWVSLRDPPYRFNHELNKFVAVGCDTIAYVRFNNTKKSYLGGCVLGCDSVDSLTDGSCSGIGCCQTSIPKGTNYIVFEFDANYNNSEVYNFSRCSYAMLTEEAKFSFNTDYITTDQLYGQSRTAVIDWVIGNTTCDTAQTNKSSYACRSGYSTCLNSSSGLGYFCNCSDGYQGNPYLEGGCRDIDECATPNPCSKRGKCHNLSGSYECSCPFGWRNKPNNLRECELNLALLIGPSAGFIALSFLGLGMYVIHEKIKLSKVEKKYFQEHGGRILLEKIQSDQGFGFTIFTKQQVEKATNFFDSANIIGHGGQGTVYRGTLRGQMVAIKKCKIVDESKKKEFGKEMVILSQINHKNIVKLIGCCLEVEIPMLIYEFIPNGTLFHYIHGKNQETNISLSTRLKIAYESAEALAYLHFSASPPIYHGDVKSANILLDQNYTAKVSDFGASILAPTDEAQFVTLVQGTCGYLDPEYMQTCQLTDKSDVYSFGVVLLELLTNKPVIAFDAPEEERSLSSRFLSAMKENKMHELLDDQIRRNEDMQLIEEVAFLAKACLNMMGEQRPNMKEVADELDRIRRLKQHPWIPECNREETETLLGESFYDIEIEHTGNFSLEKKAEKSIAFGR
ncbi:Wall-associated kinase family protein [Rhynchospora pubera]|uniref:Wall-associated kinase family protein n=1 Tax=Rhynchospora pubera TaxID=906938 RepID=A0AAV8GMT3_9POAL|nr:Wall-associated kinase family protein [Rhynchospora pubera]